MAPSLPPEIWHQVFTFALDHEPLLETGLRGSMSECTWSKLLVGDWWLREPNDSVYAFQRESYVLKKTLLRTCKSWAQIGAEFMYKSILVSNARQLQKLCDLFDRNSKLGWWTKAICIYNDRRFYSRITDVEDGLVSIISLCPNLQSLIVGRPLGMSFGNIAHTTRMHSCMSLRSIHWHIPFEAQGKVVFALEAMQNLVSLCLQFSQPFSDTEKTIGGAYIDVEFPHLKELSLRGAIQDFVEQVSTWALPELTSLALDFGENQHDFPDLLEVLSSHGPQLTALDIKSLPAFDVAAILSLCTELTTFCFSLDWQLLGVLTHRPHRKIQRIGIHGLRYAFGVGFVGSIANIKPLEALLMRRRNEANFSNLTRYNFPSLRVIRVLDIGLLRDLNRQNGPTPGDCYQRWDKWWSQCAIQNIELQDCTGKALGNLPELEFDDDLSSVGD